MTERHPHRRRLLALAELLMEETYPGHPLHFKELLKKLSDGDYPNLDERTLKDDLRVLKELPVITIKRKGLGGLQSIWYSGYPLVEADRQLVLAVKTSPTFTREQAGQLVEELLKFISSPVRLHVLVRLQLQVPGAKEEKTPGGSAGGKA